MTSGISDLITFGIISFPCTSSPHHGDGWTLQTFGNICGFEAVLFEDWGWQARRMSSYRARRGVNAASNSAGTRLWVQSLLPVTLNPKMVWMIQPRKATTLTLRHFWKQGPLTWRYVLSCVTTSNHDWILTYGWFSLLPGQNVCWEFEDSHTIFDSWSRPSFFYCKVSCVP